MDDIGAKISKIAPHAGRQANRKVILTATWNGNRGQADQLARRGKRGLRDSRRIYPHRRALGKQIARQPVKRLVRSIAHIIVVAAEQRNAKIGCLHDRCGL